MDENNAVVVVVVGVKQDEWNDEVDNVVADTRGLLLLVDMRE